MAGKLKKADYLAQNGIQLFNNMTLLKRIYFSLIMTYKYRKPLLDIYRRTPSNTQLNKISPSSLKQQGIEILALDFDGVLAAHGEAYPNQELNNWLNQCINIFGAKNIVILSNKPMQKRIDYFKSYGIEFITEVKKKPYPDGLNKIMALTGKNNQKIMLFDDRLLTGCLAACIAKVPVTYITKPYKLTLFFRSLRFLERGIMQLYSLVK
jgi:predicted HAD superfamily phosphohydrolase YqeG